MPVGRYFGKSLLFLPLRDRLVIVDSLRGTVECRAAFRYAKIVIPITIVGQFLIWKKVMFSYLVRF
jgi:hypothetical protein